MKNSFLILGNGGSGTSLLRGLVNAHPEIDCRFEMINNDPVIDQLEKWQQEVNKCGQTWSNKLPLEKCWSFGWIPADFLKIPEAGFKIIFVVRRYEKWRKNQIESFALLNWLRSRATYWALRNAYPDKIIEVSFEDLLLRPEIELRRICAFLHIRYERKMMHDGLNDTGHNSYNYGEIKLDRI